MTRGCVPDIFSGVDPFDIVMLDLGDMDLFGDYLATMESFLETRRQECSERLEAFRSEQQSGKILAVWPYDSDPQRFKLRKCGCRHLKDLRTFYAKIIRVVWELEGRVFAFFPKMYAYVRTVYR